MSEKQWSGKTKGGNFGQRFLFSTLKYIPVMFFYPIIYFVVFFFMIFNNKDYKAIVKYFRTQFKQSAIKARFSAYQNYIVFGKIVLDKFAMMTGNTKQFKFEILGQEYFDNLLNKEEGFMITSAHIGNFELLAFALHQEKKQVGGLIFGDESETYNAVRTNAYNKMKFNIISIKDDMSHLFEIKDYLSKGNILTIMCDRIFGSEKHLEMKFLNNKANFPQGPFRLALQMNVNLLSVFVVKKNIRKYIVYVKPINKALNEFNRTKQSEFIAKEFVENLEEVLLKYNKQWFNFYDFWENN